MDDLMGSEIPLHLLFRFNSRLVHVVVMYERSGNYLWNGPLRLKSSMDRTFAPFRKLDFGRYAGAYDRYHVNENTKYSTPTIQMEKELFLDLSTAIKNW